MVINLDFDGVIHSMNGMKAGSFGQPVDGAPEALWALDQEGHKLRVFTARKDLAAVERWLKERLYPKTGNLKMEVTNEKKFADVYIDDHALRFEGNWDKTINQIDELDESGEKPRQTFFNKKPSKH